MSEGWSREPAEGQTRAAAYGVVTNLSDEDVTIVSAASDVSDTVELHETVMDGDTMQMRERDGGFVVPAGGTFTFEPGGPHVMLFDVDAASYPDTVEVTLTLDDGSTLDFSAEVRSLDASTDDMDHSDMDDMDHSEMDGMDHSEMDGMDHSDTDDMDHSDMDESGDDMSTDG